MLKEGIAIVYQYKSRSDGLVHTSYIHRSIKMMKIALKQILIRDPDLGTDL